METGMQNGFISMQDVQANYGRDVADVFEQIQSEKEIAKQYGLNLAFEPFGSAENQNDIAENQNEAGNTEEN